MSRISFTLLLAVALISAGCGYSSRNYMNGNGNPRIAQLAPSSTTSGGMAFTLTLTGMGFGADSVVYWGTTPLTTAYASTTQVTADVPQANIANPGSVQVYVHSGGVNSNAVTFMIQ
jgi:IPT/TIG domain